MKRAPSLGLLLTLLSSGITAACAVAAPDASEASTSEINETAPVLDDAVATQLLAGGCQVSVDGVSTTTAGSGGACPTTLSGLLDLFDAKIPASSFVVSEQGDQPTDASYRFVIGAEGELAGKLFIATVSGGADVGEGSVEAIGFSPSLQAFVFYKSEKGRWVRKGDGAMVKAHAENAKPAFECVRCHSTGTPLMKELHDSWGNWVSPWFGMTAPTGASPLFTRVFAKRKNAERLEDFIIDATHLASKGRVDRAKAEGQLSGVLTQLMCEVGEPTLIGSHNATSKRLGASIQANPMVPSGILVNQLLAIAPTGSGPERGHDQSLQLISIDRRFAGSNQLIDSASYGAALTKAEQTIGGQPGDAIFPMSSPEKSFADLDAVQELLRQNLVDADLVGDVLMTDFTVPAFSDARCQLASTLPATWSDADDLRAKWQPVLAKSKLRGAAGLARRLADPNDRAAHTQKLTDYQAACLARGDDKGALADDLLKIVSQRRREFEERYGNLIESDWLVPQDNLGSKPHALRLDPSCNVVSAAQPFDGEE